VSRHHSSNSQSYIEEIGLKDIVAFGGNPPPLNDASLWVERSLNKKSCDKDVIKLIKKITK
jgi:hypothetical protein